MLVKVKSLTSAFKEKEIRETLPDLASDYAANDDLDFESFLRVSFVFFCVVRFVESLSMNVVFGFDYVCLADIFNIER